MQINNINQYLQQIVHQTESASNNSSSYVNQTTKDFSSFDDIYNTYVNNSDSVTKNTSAIDLYNLYSTVTKVSSSEKYTYSTENESALEVAQDAYADLLQMQADAISGSSSSDNDVEGLSDYIDELTSNNNIEDSTSLF
ncbi:MAG: hypothetical protein ACI4E1_03355 [Lachnospira sp.]